MASRKRMRITVEEQRSLHEKLRIIGMHCASCAVTIEKALRKLPGVKRASVNFASGEAVVEYDPSTTRLKDIVKTIRDVGYDAYREEAIFSVENLSSPDDEAIVEDGLSRLPGVVEVYASHTMRRVTVVYNPLVTSIDKIREVLEDMGYRVTGVSAEEAELEDLEKRIIEKEVIELRRALIVSLPLSIFLGLMVFVFKPLTGIPQQLVDVIGFIISTIVLAVGGRRFFIGAWRALKNRSAGMDTLVALGTGAAYLFSTAVLLGIVDGSTYFEAPAFIISFILLGRYVEVRMKQRTGEAVRKLLELQPPRARRVRDGVEEEVPLEEIRVGDTVVVKPGERIPVDGVVVEGQGYVDESMVTGEPVPVAKKPGDPVIAGTLLETGFLKVKVTRVGKDTVLAQIVRLVRHAQTAKPPIQRIVDRIAGIFAWIVMAIAVLVFTYWYLVAGLPLGQALVFAASVLLIACPCALGLASPLAVVVGVGRAAEYGVVVRNIECVEKAVRLTTVVFDKTGTLTKGRPEVVAVVPQGMEEDELLRLAAAAEKRSEHPIARAIVEAAKSKRLQLPEPEMFDSIPGQGVVAVIDGRTVAVGNEKLMEGFEVNVAEVSDTVEELRGRGATVVYVAVDGRLVGVIAVADKPRDYAREVVKALHEMGLRTVMLTGDNRRTAEAVARSLGIDEVIAEASPEEKAEKIKELQRKGHVVAMVGDGINDAPSLAQADIGIAMGRGTDVAKEAGDIILVRNDLRGVVAAIEAAKTIYRKIKENLLWAFIYNTTLIPVAAGTLYGYGIALRPEMAAAAMALSSISVTLNALRLRKWRPRIMAKLGEAR